MIYSYLFYFVSGPCEVETGQSSIIVDIEESRGNRKCIFFSWIKDKYCPVLKTRIFGLSSNEISYLSRYYKGLSAPKCLVQFYK